MAVRCLVCGEELETGEALEAHHHGIPASWEEGGAGFSCPACGAELDSEEGLVSHEAMEHSTRGRRGTKGVSRIRPGAPRDRRPPRHWPQG